MARTATHDAVLVVLAVALQLALWLAFRWLGLQVHGEVPGAPIPEWFGFLSPPLTRIISIAPAFLVGWFATRHGAALGALAGVLASVASWGFQTLPGAWSGWSLSSLVNAPISNQISSALAAAILGGVAGAAGVFFSQRVRAGPSLHADAPHAGVRRGGGPPVS